MEAREVDRRSSGSPKPMRCMRCNGTFKRLEHLRRHERIHETRKRYICSQCFKVFTRSDILRRHEATHVAIESANGARPTKKRACTECARSRERCTKSEPCQRCSARGFRCVYPQERPNARIQLSHSEQGRVSESTNSPTQHDPHDPGGLGNGTMAPVPDQPAGLFAETEPSNALHTYATYHSLEGHVVPFETTDSMHTNGPSDHIVQPTVDFPMNWLPPDNSLALDYSSIVGLDFSSLDYYPFPSTSAGVTGMTTTTQIDEGDKRVPGAANVPMDELSHHGRRPDAFGQQKSFWNIMSPEGVGIDVSSESPHSPMQTTSPEATPGGLYATSRNGARMPCTVRARRTSRLIPGTTPIEPITDATFLNHENRNDLEFPDTSHITVDRTILSIDNALNPAQILTSTVYEDMRRNFSKLCLTESCIFPMYKSTSYPDLPTLNLFVKLYHENFDDIIPILHDEVTRMNDHWMLALAVCAIGCQYAEADEFSRSVEPLHEFLRRAITVESTGESVPTKEMSERDVALVQAMVLNQIGMFYLGSPKLLRYARAQHSALIEVVRHLACGSSMRSKSTKEFYSDSDPNLRHTAWKLLLFEECKHRISYTIWLLDCMVVYHFLQQPLMPPDFVPVPLPNDTLWATKSAENWAMQPASSYETPSLSAAIVSLFREKHVTRNLGQFSRVVLLHGVYREIFRLKDCFAGPLGGWTPSIQQLETDLNGPRGLSDVKASGQPLLNSRRNAALDCVDVLHWAANGTIALQAGAEHPTVLHLHLSRTVLLTPFERIQTLADSIVSFVQDPLSRTLDASSREHVIGCERDILEWAQRDQCKARLAVLHSGCLFWHIRRYSWRAFYEPISIYLATLTIWAYSSYASRSYGAHHDLLDQFDVSSQEEITTRSLIGEDLSAYQGADDAHSSPSDDSTSLPTFIHLDRPNDDEMVQAFVRFGTSSAMRANITGVGDIYSPKGPAKVLKEGRKILAAISTAWGRTDKYASTLAMLEQVASGHVPLNSRKRS